MEAVRLFLEEAGKMGTLEQVLEEAGYICREGRRKRPVVAPSVSETPLPHVAFRRFFGLI